MQPEVDPLWPNGDRPMCHRCHERPVYLGGLCSKCFADDGVAEVVRLKSTHTPFRPPRRARSRRVR